MSPFDSEQNNAGPHGIGAGASNSAVSTAGAGAAPAGAGAASAVGVSAAHGRDSGVSPFASRNSSAFNALMGADSAEAEDSYDEESPEVFAENPDVAAAALDGVLHSGSSSDSGLNPNMGGTGRKNALRLVSPGALVVHLLKDYIDREDNKVLFESLVRQELAVSSMCRTLFLRLVIDQDSGFAYVRSLADDELPPEVQQRPPRLLSRKALPFYDSLILILLRQRLLDFEMSGQFGRLVLERAEILTMVKTFIHQVNNDKSLDDKLHKSIENLCSLGLLGKNKSGTTARGRTAKNERDLERIEVKRIIGVIVTPEILKQADDTLASYLKRIKEGGRNRLDDDDDEQPL